MSFSSRSPQRLRKQVRTVMIGLALIVGTAALFVHTPPAVQLVAAGQASPPGPQLTSTSVVWPATAHAPLVIRGSGLGTLAPYQGNSAYLEITDTTAGWSAGYEPGGNAVGLDVVGWSPTQITISGFTGPYGSNGFVIAPGDRLVLSVWNPQSGAGPGTALVTPSAYA